MEAGKKGRKRTLELGSTFLAAFKKLKIDVPEGPKAGRGDEAAAEFVGTVCATLDQEDLEDLEKMQEKNALSEEDLRKHRLLIGLLKERVGKLRAEEGQKQAKEGQKQAEEEKKRAEGPQIFEEGVVFDIFCEGGANDSSVSEHLDAKWVGASPFACLPDSVIRPRRAVSTLHQVLLSEGGSYIYSGEAGIAGLVERALSDVAQACGLNGMYTIQWETTIAGGDRPDLLFLRNSATRKVLGFCEVKKPGRAEPLAKPKIRGQMFDYLLQMRLDYGILCPLGILTTFEQWWVCWLDDAASHAAAQASELAAVRAAGGVDVQKVSRAIACSEPVASYREPRLARVLASVLMKMLESPRILDEQLRGAARFYFTDHSCFWKGVEDPIPQYCRPPFPLERVEWLKGGGRDGRCCWVRACVGGEPAAWEDRVVKFLREGAATSVSGVPLPLDQVAADEARRWKQLWDLPAVALKVNGYHAVLMPKLEPFPDELRAAATWPEKIKALLRQAVQHAASRGVAHPDLVRRDATKRAVLHLGNVAFQALGGGGRRAVLIDLTQLEEDLAPDVAMQKMGTFLALVEEK